MAKNQRKVILHTDKDELLKRTSQKVIGANHLKAKYSNNSCQRVRLIFPVFVNYTDFIYCARMEDGFAWPLRWADMY